MEPITHGVKTVKRSKMLPSCAGEGKGQQQLR